jgi:hypothetical protein
LSIKEVNVTVAVSAIFAISVSLLGMIGMILCFVFAKFVLGAVFLGNISATFIIEYPTRAVILELALFFSGLYESDFTGPDITSHRKEINLSLTKVLWIAFVFGLADLGLSFVSFNVTMFFLPLVLRRVVYCGLRADFRISIYIYLCAMPVYDAGPLICIANFDRHASSILLKKKITANLTPSSQIDEAM